MKITKNSITITPNELHDLRMIDPKKAAWIIKMIEKIAGVTYKNHE